MWLKKKTKKKTPSLKKSSQSEVQALGGCSGYCYTWTAGGSSGKYTRPAKNQTDLWMQQEIRVFVTVLFFTGPVYFVNATSLAEDRVLKWMSCQHFNERQQSEQSRTRWKFLQEEKKNHRGNEEKICEHLKFLTQQQTSSVIISVAATDSNKLRVVYK